MREILFILKKGILFIYILLLFFTAVKDIKTKRIEDKIPIMISILAILYRSFEFFSPQIIFQNGNEWIGLLAGFFPFFCIAFLCGTEKMGGGDVKFMAANGLFLGEKVLLASMLGLGLAVIALFIFILIKKPKSGIALAPFLGTGCFICLFIS